MGGRKDRTSKGRKKAKREGERGEKVASLYNEITGAC